MKEGFVWPIFPIFFDQFFQFCSILSDINSLHKLCFCVILHKAFLTVLVNIYIYIIFLMWWSTMSAFPWTFLSCKEWLFTCGAIITIRWKRDIYLVNFNIKQRETSKATHPTIFWKRHWKKVPMTAWETSLFNGCTHTHSCLASFPEREICNHFGREKTHQNINKKWRKTSKGTHRSIFWRRRWKSTIP